MGCLLGKPVDVTSRLSTVLLAVREKIEQLEALDSPTPAELDLKCELIAAVADMERAERDSTESAVAEIQRLPEAAPN